MQDLFHDSAFIMLVANLLCVWPLAHVLVRAGLDWRWSLVTLVPLVGMTVVFGVLTFRRWPNRPVTVRRAPKARREA